MSSHAKQKDKEKGGLGHTLLTVLGVILCVILTPILLINLTLIARSYLQPDKVPDVAGMLPLIVLTDSMYPEIQSGDLIICRTTEPEKIAEGDVIAFFDPVGSGTSVVTHRVIEVVNGPEGLSWRTRGDANNADDTAPVPAANLVGVYRSRLPGFGNVAMFMQTTQGLIVCVVCPVLLLVGYDMIRRRLYDKQHKQDTDALMKELEELRAAKAAQEK